MEKLFQVKTVEDFQLVIQYIFEQIDCRSPLIITLSGDLGAGKTAFTKELGKFLGLTEIISSPTYTIMKQYQLNHQNYSELFHLDAYRIEDEEEVGPLHLESVFNKPKTIVCVEWPEKIRATIPTNAINIEISITDGDTREVRLSQIN